MIHIKNHKQKNLFDPWHFLGPKRRELLDQSWAGLFQKELLCELPVGADGGNNSLFLKSLSGVYRHFLDATPGFEILVPASAKESRVEVTGCPQGLPSWKVKYGDKATGAINNR